MEQKIVVKTKDRLAEFTLKIQQFEHNIKNNFWNLGVILCHIQKEKLYKKDYKTFKQYIDENFTFSLQTAYNMTRISEKFSRDQFFSLGVGKCLELLKITEQDRDITIKTANNSTVAELKHEITGKKADSRGRKPKILTLILVDDMLYRPYKKVKNKEMLAKIRKKHKIKKL